MDAVSDAIGDEFIDRLRNQIDKKAIAALGQRKAIKYADVDHWLNEMWGDAKGIDLHRSLPLRILDIGTGPGYFPYICKALGHDCIGLDRPGLWIYRELRKVVGTEAVPHHILPQVSLPEFPHRFDLVTTFRAPFNTVEKEQRLFNVDDWNYFLDDLRDNVLVPNGSFHMRMNIDWQFPGLTLETSELRDLFISRGAELRAPRIVHFESIA